MAKKGALIVAGLAAYAYYRYNKMTPQEKENMKSTLKKQGQKIVDSLPAELKNIFNPEAAKQ